MMTTPQPGKESPASTSFPRVLLIALLLILTCGAIYLFFAAPLLVVGYSASLPLHESSASMPRIGLAVVAFHAFTDFGVHIPPVALLAVVVAGFASAAAQEIGFIPPRVPFNPHDPQQADYRLSWDRDTPPAQRPHAIPVAWTGSDVDGNLDRSFCAGEGIKGAFWANYLSEIYVRKAGGAQSIAASLPGIRIEALHDGGLLVVVTESPLPEDSDENRQRFLAVHRVLQPAFLSRAEMAANKRALLGHYYREYLSVLP